MGEEEEKGAVEDVIEILEWRRARGSHLPREPNLRFLSLATLSSPSMGTRFVPDRYASRDTGHCSHSNP
jgi:hypothetical protein